MVKRKITLCSESLRSGKGTLRRDQQYSYDGTAIISLLKKNLAALQSEQVEIEAVGFGGKKMLMEKAPKFVKNELAEYVNRSKEVFIILLQDSDTNDNRKISTERRKLEGKIKKLVDDRNLERVHVMFAVQAIEAWILSDAKGLNEYLLDGKAKHENSPESISNPKQLVKNFFEQCGKSYTPQELVELLPSLDISELFRCKHFKALYDCIENICSAA